MSEPRHAPIPSWLWGLAGVGLLLAGVIIGAVLATAVILYRLPPPEARPADPPTLAPTPWTPLAAHSPAPTASPPPTRLPVGPGVGQRAPDWVLADVEGITYTLAAYQGQTVILTFWAAWCPRCREALPEMYAFAQGPDGARAVVLAINVEEMPEVVREWSETAPFPLLLDHDGRVSERYQIAALPTTILIDPDGIVRQVIPGVLDAAALARLVRP